MTLNDVMAVILLLFHRIRVRCCHKTITSVSKSTFDSLWPY